MISSVTLAVVIGVYVVLAAWYLIACWRQPYNRCPQCFDFPHLRERCLTCNRTGAQLRWGARLLRRK